MPTKEAFDYLIELLNRDREKITSIRLEKAVRENPAEDGDEEHGLRTFTILEGETVTIEINGGSGNGVVGPPEVWKEL
jgi:hypothetical protein